MNKYSLFISQITKIVPGENIYTDELRRLAWGTDAGFYRLIPRVVIRSRDEEEVAAILSVAHSLHIPVTFRAGGTSLSGQAITDSVLIVAGKNWESYRVSADGGQITLQPGLTGERVNRILKPYGRIFPPDPASLKSAMVGGIVMNNASGMSCGIHANSDRILLSARIVFIDGTILDTGNAESRDRFRREKPDFIPRIEALRDRVRSDKTLTALIRRKYAIKNVIGLNLLPFIRFTDPFDIIAHLMVGSEGTLAFLSEVTMQTGILYPYRASAMVYFEDIREACHAVVALRRLTGAGGEVITTSAELLDSKALTAAGDTTGTGLTALLLETKTMYAGELQENISAIQNELTRYATFQPVVFTAKEEEYAAYWATRSGIFPAVGGNRRPGTTTLIEDVAFPLDNLPSAVADLQKLLQSHGYEDACIYGHALEGNFHFILNQSFETREDISRYEMVMDELATLVVHTCHGSLKAEHGTGRNMAPFVKTEWGEEAFDIMRSVKQLFDPGGLLNPGVIFNEDPACHLKHIKPLPPVDSAVDKCIECGFCEVNCLTCGLTLSPRQRIVIRREIARLHAAGDNPRLLRTLQRQYRYLGEQTCAGDGLCADSCPMQINTGTLTHHIRGSRIAKSRMACSVGSFTARHLAGLKQALRLTLQAAYATHRLLGTRLMQQFAKFAHRPLHFPLWTPAMPKAFRLRGDKQAEETAGTHSVVYFPSCLNQTMGTASNASSEEQPVVHSMLSLLRKAGYRVIYPEGMESLCCGTIWESKGMEEIANRKSAELEEALWEASRHGQYPVLCDQSPCLYRMRRTMTRIDLYEPVEFIYTFLRDKLRFTPIDNPVAIHVTCSMRKMGLADRMLSLAHLCARTVIIPEETGCCGFAGDKGFTHPEVNRYALRHLRRQIEHHQIEAGYSNSRTCEIGLSTHSGIAYKSIVTLVDGCTNGLEFLT